MTNKIGKPGRGKNEKRLAECVASTHYGLFYNLPIAKQASNTLQNNRHTKFHDGNQSTVVDCFPNQLAEIQ